MASVVISGDTSGSVSLTVPAAAGTNTITFPAVTGTVVAPSVTPYLVGYTPSVLQFRLNAGLAGANSTAVQSVFGVGVTLSASTQYEFEINCTLAKTAGAVSHSFSILFGGTATLNNILYGGIAKNASNSMPVTFNSSSTGNIGSIDSATASIVYSGSVSAAVTTMLFLKGTVSINAGGTFIPQYTLSAAPGGAYTTQAGSFIKVTPLAASGANVNIGGWA
jgi:hypothetical protein